MFENVMHGVRATLELKLCTFQGLFYFGNFAETLNFS